LPFHLQRALDNGLSTEELAEVITHLAFYSGWPTAASALNLLSELQARLLKQQE
jgi:4-carboxymuconolactone decarboxylase